LQVTMATKPHPRLVACAFVCKRERVAAHLRSLARVFLTPTCVPRVLMTAASDDSALSHNQTKSSFHTTRPNRPFTQPDQIVLSHNQTKSSYAFFVEYFHIFRLGRSTNHQHSRALMLTSLLRRASVENKIFFTRAQAEQQPRAFLYSSACSHPAFCLSRDKLHTKHKCRCYHQHKHLN
jgi:hypothetical protein